MKKIYISSNTSNDIANNLKSLGYYPVLLPPSSRLDTPVASHADMLLYKLGDELLVCEYYYMQNKELFEGEKLLLTAEKHEKNYPNDILFNAFVYKDMLVGKLEKLSVYVREYYSSFTCVNVKQGYAKCSCVVTDDTCITADKSIFDKLKNKNCIEIGEGDVELDGYDKGFLGGASFYDDGKVFFFGDLYTHKDGKRIESQLKKYGTETVCLSNGPLKDLGGAVISA